MLIHKLSVESDIDEMYAPILATESYLIDTCKEYNIEYSTCECKPTIIQEGLVSGFINIVKTLFQKAIAFLIKIWKVIVNFMKSLFKRAVSFFKQLFGIKTKKPVEMTVPVISKPGHMEKVDVKNPQAIAAAYKTAIANFNQEIAKESKTNISLTKRMEQTVISRIHESYSPVPVEEDVEYNKTNKEAMPNVDKYGKTSTSFKKQLETGAEEAFTKQYGYLKEQLGSQWDTYLGMFKDMLKVYSYQGDNLFEHESVHNISLLNVKLAKRAVDSKHVIQLYEMVKADSIARYKEKLKQVSALEGFNKVAGIQSTITDCKTTLDLFDRMVKEDNVSETDLFKFISGNFFPSFDDEPDQAKKEAKIRKYLKIRIQWNENIIATLQRMVVLNQEMLGISSEEATLISKQLEKGELQGVKDLLYQNRDKIISKDHCIVDGRKLGLGVICISDDIAKDSFTEDDSKADMSHKGFWLNIGNIHMYDDAISYMTNYDLTVLAHGDSNGTWIMEKTKLPNGSYSKLVTGDSSQCYVNDYIHECIKQGFKKINLLACNGGSHDLDDDIRNNPKVLIRHSKTVTMS